MGLLSSPHFKTGMVRGFFGSINDRRDRKQQIADNIAQARRTQEAELAKTEYTDAVKRAQEYKRAMDAGELGPAGYTQEMAEKLVSAEFGNDPTKLQYARQKPADGGLSEYERLVQVKMASGKALYSDTDLEAIKSRFDERQAAISNIRGERQYTNWDRLGSATINAGVDYVKRGIDEVQGKPKEETQAAQTPQAVDGGNDTTVTPVDVRDTAVTSGNVDSGISEADNAQMNREIAALESAGSTAPEGTPEFATRPADYVEPSEIFQPREYPKAPKKLQGTSDLTDADNKRYTVFKWDDGTTTKVDTGLSEAQVVTKTQYDYTAKDGTYRTAHVGLDKSGTVVKHYGDTEMKFPGQGNPRSKPFDSPIYDKEFVESSTLQNRALVSLRELQKATNVSRANAVDWTQGKLREVVDSTLANLPMYSEGAGEEVAAYLSGQIGEESVSWGFVEQVRAGDITVKETMATFALARSLLGPGGRLTNSMLETARSALGYGAKGGIAQQTALLSLLDSYETKARRATSSVAVRHNDQLVQLPAKERVANEILHGYVFFSDTGASQLLKRAGVTGDDYEAIMHGLINARKDGMFRYNEEGVPVGLRLQRDPDDPSIWKLNAAYIYNE